MRLLSRSLRVVPWFPRIALVISLLVPAAHAVDGAALGSGSQTCPASGNKRLSTTQTKAVWISVQAPSANTGAVYVGGSAITTSSGTFITSGGNSFLPTAGNAAVYDLSQTFIACTVSGDSVTFSYLQ